MMVLMSVTEARLKTHCAETKIFTKLYTQLSKLCNKLKIYFIFERRKKTRTWTFPLVENSEQNMEILVVYMFCG